MSCGWNSTVVKKKASGPITLAKRSNSRLSMIMGKVSEFTFDLFSCRPDSRSYENSVESLTIAPTQTVLQENLQEGQEVDEKLSLKTGYELQRV